MRSSVSFGFVLLLIQSRRTASIIFSLAAISFHLSFLPVVLAVIVLRNIPHVRLYKLFPLLPLLSIPLFFLSQFTLSLLSTYIDKVSIYMSYYLLDPQGFDVLYLAFYVLILAFLVAILFFSPLDLKAYLTNHPFFFFLCSTYSIGFFSYILFYSNPIIAKRISSSFFFFYPYILGITLHAIYVLRSNLSRSPFAYLSIGFIVIIVPLAVSFNPASRNALDALVPIFF